MQEGRQIFKSNVGYFLFFLQKLAHSVLDLFKLSKKWKTFNNKVLMVERFCYYSNSNVDILEQKPQFSGRKKPRKRSENSVGVRLLARSTWLISSEASTVRQQIPPPQVTGDRWHLVRTCNWRWWEGGLLQPALVKFFLLVLLLKVLISVLSIYSETNQPLRTSTSETFKRAWERDNFLCRPAVVLCTISLTLLGGKLYILVFIWKIKSFHFI